MAPGQIHFVFTLSQWDEGEELSIGAIMHGTFFLSPRCMTRSLHSSWVDRHLQSTGNGEVYRHNTITTILTSFVSDSRRRLSLGHRSLIGDPTPKDIFSAMFMAMMYTGHDGGESTVVQHARGIVHHYSKLYPEDFAWCRWEFFRVKAANLSDNTGSFTPEEVTELRRPMKEAVEHMIRLCF
jgi:hypothetical protein